MQVFLSYLVCPECQARNTPWRSFCKICRGPLYSHGRRALVQTDITLTMYRARDPRTLLLLSPQFIGFETPGLAIQSAWENIASLGADLNGPYLLLRKPAALSIEGERFPDQAFSSRWIPLRPFGFPEHSMLRQDLLRYLPERVRRRMRI